MVSARRLLIIHIISLACLQVPPPALGGWAGTCLHTDQERASRRLREAAAETQNRFPFARRLPQQIQRLMYDPDADVMGLSEGANGLVPDALLIGGLLPANDLTSRPSNLATGRCSSPVAVP